ncbi:LCP family protein [Streptomyces sp. F63]|uniref:LCP family protein n=1 Tax=Streptomyces sp. F63 TaxID=2824887 RepID=UPI001B36D16A|nr:LCP family protein [Streptomyces sp. F63]MBQ0987203.1 LCP family protein [Streptomyces sp. F63]
MDAQGRGRADDIDPADQWVLDPNTGNYVLRLQAPAARPAAPAPRRGAAPAPAPRSEPGRAASRSGPPRSASRRAAPAREEAQPGMPPQRGRRAAPRPGGGGSSRRKRRQRAGGKKKALYWTGGVMAFVLVAGGATAYALLEHFNGNISTVDVGDAGSDTITDGPMNILVLGTDTRTGKGNEGYGDKNSVGHADTTILFHVSEDRTNATALSIPRDLITDIPDCPTKQPDGTTDVIPGQQQTRFNKSLGQGGRDPGCTMRTVEKITGLQVDHFMMADFNAVKTLSTAVGGVDVCLAKDIDDPKSHLKLSAGKHTIMGDDALAFVRTRHGLQFESDLDRIKLQQQFLGSMIRKMKSGDTLSDPKKMWKLAEAATNALTVNTGIGTVNKLIALAENLKKIDLKNITFVTLPVVNNPAEKVASTVVLNEAEAEPLFAMMRDDVSLTEVAKKKKADKAAKDKAKLKGDRAEPSEVRVEVLNSGAPVGAAQTTVDWLQNSQGVIRSANAGNAPGEELAKTVLEYAPNQADQARALADMMGLSASALKPGTEDAGPTDTMTLTLGRDFDEPGKPLSAPTKAPENIQRVEADKQVCAQ